MNSGTSVFSPAGCVVPVPNNSLAAPTGGDENWCNEWFWFIHEGDVCFSDREQFARAKDHELELSKYFYGQETFSNESRFIKLRASTEGRPFLYNISKRSLRQNIESIWFRCYWIKISPVRDKFSCTHMISNFCTSASPRDLLWHKHAWDFQVLWTDIGQTISSLCVHPTNSHKANFLAEKKNPKIEFSQAFFGIT